MVSVCRRKSPAQERSQGSSARRRLRRGAEHQRGDRERGAALVEAAFVTPVFLLIIFGLLEFGLIARSELTVANTSKDAGRAASVFSNDAFADYWILETVKQSVAPLGEDKIEAIVVFRIENVGDEMNPLCLTQSVSVATDPVRPCNRYTQAELNLDLYEADGVTPTGYWGCDINALAVDDAWCSKDRETKLSNGLDLVGVYVEAKHTYITGFFGTERDVTDFTVIQVEPQES